MPCTSPLDAWPAPPGAADRRPVFSPTRSYRGAKAFFIPCGKCESCRSERRSNWATRGVHELSQHEGASFVTLTFADEHLPADREAVARHWQLFRMRVRKSCGAFRFIACGERGSQRGRWHLHAILYGLDFRADRAAVGRSFGGPLYSSATLNKLWPFGHAVIADVSASSIAYVCGYTAKKLGDDAAAERPLFFCSRAIGGEWFRKFRDDAFPSDFLIRDGQRVPVPRFYVQRLTEAEQAELKAKRIARAITRRDEQRDSRLIVKHESAALRAKRRARALDDAL